MRFPMHTTTTATAEFNPPSKEKSAAQRILSDRSLDRASRMMALAAMSMADPVTGRFTAEIEEIADEMGSSVSTVIRATKILEEAGLLQVTRSHRKAGTYTINVE